jgi:HK97 family phage major capsid protein
VDIDDLIAENQRRAQVLVDRVRAEGREEFSLEEKAASTRLLKEQHDLTARKARIEDRERRLGALDQMTKGPLTHPAHIAAAGGRGSAAMHSEDFGPGLGQHVVASGAYQALIRAGVSDHVRVNLGPIPAPGGLAALLGPRAKAAGDPVGIGGLAPPSAFSTPQAALEFARPLTIRDLLTIGRSESDMVQFTRTRVWAPAAAPVAEGAVKPASELQYEKAFAAVRTIASWVAASKQALGDAGQLRTLIDSFLVYAVNRVLEDQIVNGSGEGENFRGFLADPDLQVLPFDTDLLTTARRAKRLVETVGADSATAYVVSPAVDESIDLLRDAMERYYGAGPFSSGPRALWGIPRVVSHALPDTTALVGNFRHAVLWDRMQAAISVSDSHSDFFTRNMVAILGEGRAAFGVLKPQALVRFSTTGGEAAPETATAPAPAAAPAAPPAAKR